jgi:AsmA protein
MDIDLTGNQLVCRCTWTREAGITDLMLFVPEARGAMPSSTVRTGVWAVVATVLVAALIVAALPLAASTRIVRDRIAYQMSIWSGFRVAMGTAPEIEVWPSFRAVLRDVRLSEWGDPGQTPIIRAARVEIDLSALAALRGKVDFSTVQLVRPVLRVRRRNDAVVTPVSATGGRIALAIGSARQAIAADPTMPEISSLPPTKFGTVGFSDGRIEISDDGGDSEVVSNVRGSLSWPELTRTGTLSASGIWRGEAVALRASSQQPLVLLAGGNAPLSFSLEAKPLNASFSGTANLSQARFIEGDIDLSSPSLRRALEWSRTEVSPGAAIGAVALTARMTGSGNRFKFANARITVNDNPGMGVLDLSFANSVPSVSGTLAFETIDLMSFLSAFTTFPSGNGATVEKIDTSFTDQIKLDLRLSAAKANAGGIELTDVAATTQVQDGLAAFDISDASVFSGTVQAGLRFDMDAQATQAELRLLASDIDSGALVGAAGLKRFVPTGRATISVVLKSEIKDWTSIFDKAVGTVSAKMGSATMSGIDLAAFLKRCSEGGFFALSDLPEGSMAIEGAELKGAVSNGIARIETAKVRAGTRTISIAGIIPYVGRGLALSGTIAPGTPDGLEGPETAFFVGGPWSAPFVSPIISREEW